MSTPFRRARRAVVAISLAVVLGGAVLVATATPAAAHRSPTDHACAYFWTPAAWAADGVVTDPLDHGLSPVLPPVPVGGAVIGAHDLLCIVQGNLDRGQCVLPPLSLLASSRPYPCDGPPPFPSP